ncbi:MAG: hypothetical protein LBE32_05440 [Burkholderiales bacterium]|jgi:prefoldin subunit 5|nr:hypothetical protein [Burkholderiales bacterium]
MIAHKHIEAVDVLKALMSLKIIFDKPVCFSIKDVIVPFETHTQACKTWNEAREILERTIKAIEDEMESAI